MATAKKSKVKLNKNNTTGYHGVTRNSKGEYVAQIYHREPGAKKGKTTRIGEFKKAIDAAKAYDTRAVEIHGDKAKLNFPAK